jgi:hypothetical protein
MKKYISPETKCFTIDVQTALLAASDPNGMSGFTNPNGNIGDPISGQGDILSKNNALWGDDE